MGTRGDFYSALPVAPVPARSDSQAKARPGRQGALSVPGDPSRLVPSRPALTRSGAACGGPGPRVLEARNRGSEAGAGALDAARRARRAHPGGGEEEGGPGEEPARRRGSGSSSAAATVPATAFAAARRLSEPGFFTCETGASVAMGRAVAKAPMR